MGLQDGMGKREREREREQYNRKGKGEQETCASAERGKTQASSSDSRRQGTTTTQRTDGVVGEEGFVPRQNDAAQGLQHKQPDEPVRPVPERLPERHGGFYRTPIALEGVAPERRVVFVAVVAFEKHFLPGEHHGLGGSRSRRRRSGGTIDRDVGTSTSSGRWRVRPLPVFRRLPEPPLAFECFKDDPVVYLQMQSFVLHLELLDRLAQGRVLPPEAGHILLGNWRGCRCSDAVHLVGTGGGVLPPRPPDAGQYRAGERPVMRQRSVGRQIPMGLQDQSTGLEACSPPQTNHLDCS